MRFEVLMVVNIKLKVFWAAMPHSAVADEDGGSKVFQKVGILPQHYMVSQPRRP
jgi:hypothetical protein